MKRFIISASRTLDGAPVYLTSANEWVESFQDAATFEKSNALDGALANARSQQAQVCDPFSIAVVVDDGVLRATQGKWTLRAEGATRVLSALGYAQEEESGHVSI